MKTNFRIKLSLPAGTVLPTIVRAELDEALFAGLSALSADGELVAVSETAGLELACQLSGDALTASPQGTDREAALYVLAKDVPLPLDAELSLAVRPRSEAVPVDRRYNPWSELPGVHLDHQEDRERVIVSIEGRLFTRYLYSAGLAKPYYYPLIGPHGKTLIQDGPDDHLHHHGIWWGHDDVNGHKLYHEFRGEGKQVHRTFLTLAGGPVFGQITSLIDWLDEDGNLLLQETRTARVYNLPPESRYTDFSTQLFASSGGVTFGDTKEGGFPFIRVNEQINGHHTGVITAGNGKAGEAEIFGTTAEWVDYSGRLFVRINRDGESPEKEYAEAGIAVFTHPSNEDYASQWFVRDYGPFTPANFHFCGGKTMQAGDSLAMRHRVYVHAGDSAAGNVKERYTEYVSPPAAEVVSS
ncbi:PmoA family protein [Paenibacillus humicola]|uniref:DUF6807 domain-containing protein n=1 Tax=Paenibacillus humicola TaxID=3110540 RepID=UPI00237A14A4|nr:PmoA family protein [Paenibacillus humicola]